MKIPTPTPFLILLSLIFTSLPPNTKSQNLISNLCDTSLNYTLNSTFQENLSKLFFSLIQNTPKTGFSNDTKGVSPDQVYGLALCRGDISNDYCSGCVQLASRYLPQLCPSNKGGIAWYEKCLVRYSYEDFFSNLTDSYSWSADQLTEQNVSDPLRFTQEITTMFDKISEMGAYNLSYKYFTTGEIADVMGPVYGMVQCTRDLSQNDCFKCLNDSLRDILNCCVWATTAAALRGSCVLRYDWQKFYDSNPNWIWNVRINSDPGLVPLSPQPVNHSDSSYSGSKKGNGNKTLPVALGISISIVFLAVLVVSIFIFIKRRKRPRNQFNGQNILENVKSKKSLLFEFSALEKATNNFSNSNILGAGGFGPVYKGKLLDGKEIAVKRLARGSEQGLSELTNEVQFLAELQHKNLVRLFGVCLEKNEMLLVYEYIRNKSLDTLLFDDTSGIRRLNWEERLKIIQGISKGLLYLHQDSAIRLIHRDLKASNILIDGNMNPKISDFGLARLLGGDHTQSKTTRVVGTYGYMAPEYAIQGTVSTKVDIFSFGVLILEIISGKRNSSFSGSNEGSLINYAWGNWRNSTVTNIIDQSLGDESGTNLEAVRCINIGLLCVQENPNKRPDINLVNLMLTRQRMQIPQPSSPAFIFGDYNLEENSHASSSISSVNFSANYVSCSEVYPR